MAGHRDDGTFAEDKAHHPNRKVHREMFIEPDQANPLGMVRPSTNAIPDAHDPGNLGEMNHDARLSNALQKYFKIDEYAAGDVISAHKEGDEYLSDAYYGVNYPEPGNSSPADDDNIGSRIGYIPQAISKALDAYDTGVDSRGYSSPHEYPPSVRVRGDK